MSEEYRSSGTPVRRSRRNLPLVLIGIGLLILVANAGPFGSVLWSVVWPIGLIAVGVDLITEGRQRRRIGLGALLGVVVLGPLVGGARFVDNGRVQLRDVGQAGGRACPALQDVDRVQAQITQTAGDLSIAALPGDSPELARVGREGQINSCSATDRTGTLSVVPGTGWGVGDLDLRLTRQVPLDLTIDMAAGSARRLDFADLRLEKLSLTVRAGDAEVKLPDSGVIDVTVAGGVGDVEIDVPEDLAARIEIQSGVGEIEYDEDRFRNENSVLFSDGYSEESPNRATIRIANSAGRIEIK